MANQVASIGKVKGLVGQRLAADQIAQDIKTVLSDGKAEDAANLATASLKQYGSGDGADQLVQLKRQADALASVESQDNRVRHDRLRREGEAALAEKNLRAAALAFEQALQYGEDAGVRRQAEEIQAALARYDDNRRRAAELRRDPANLEDAVAALQEAARTWDTAQVREEIELYTLALQRRRSTISVADFEIRGDVGIPYASRTIAEELLPAFKSRFDLVERGQLNRVLDELKFDASELAGNGEGRREVGRLAKVQYLVLGSVAPLSGITVNARLVEVRSGLIVQTAKFVARSPQEMLQLLPQLANLLMMTDDQKIAYEQQLIQRSPIIIQSVVEAPLPPPPALPIVGQPLPPPIIVYNPRPPALGGLVRADLDTLPLAGGSGISLQLISEHDGPVKRKLLQIAVSLGDDLFRRGRYREAHRHFELALSISPHEVDLHARLERCQPHLPPPPPPVVIVSRPPIIAVVRPRIAVVNFLVTADPAHAPPGFGDWAADLLGSYFAPTYEVVDRGELYWYMGRLGLTVRDVATDVSARRWLGRALNVRYFAFGIVQQTASLNVSTHLVDAESGAKQGLGSIHVQDQQDLKLRMAELARQTQTQPAERDGLQREAQETEKQLNQVRQLLAQGQIDQAIQASQDALKKNPNDVGMRVLLTNAEKQAKAAALAQRQAEQQRQTLAAAVQQKQQELARLAEAAKQKASQDAAARTEAAKRAQEQQRQLAHDRLMAQGAVALKQQNVKQAIQFFQSAVAIRPSDDGVRALDDARALAEKNAQAQAAQDQARRAAEMQKQREAEMAGARTQLEDQRRRQETDAQAQRKAQEARDQAAAANFVEDGKKLLAQGKFDAALTSLQAAERLHKTNEVEGLITQASEKAVATKQDGKARADQARLLADQKARRDQAEAKAAHNRELYTRALQEAQKAFTEKRYDQAVSKYQEADNLFHTDAVLNGLRQVKETQDKDRAAAEVVRQKQLQQQQQAEAVKHFLSTGGTALAAGQLENSAKAFADAKKLAPDNAEVLKGVIQTEQAQQQRLLQMQKKLEEQKHLEAEARQTAAAGNKKAGNPGPNVQENPAPSSKSPTTAPQPKAIAPAITPQPKPPPLPPNVAAEYAKQMQLAAALEKQQKYDDAMNAYKTSLKLMPGDLKATVGLHMAGGQKALAARKFAEAVKEFEEVLRVSPNHAEATKALKQARQGRP